MAPTSGVLGEKLGEVVGQLDEVLELLETVVVEDRTRDISVRSGCGGVRGVLGGGHGRSVVEEGKEKVGGVLEISPGVDPLTYEAFDCTRGCAR